MGKIETYIYIVPATGRRMKDLYYKFNFVFQKKFAATGRRPKDLCNKFCVYFFCLFHPPRHAALKIFTLNLPFFVFFLVCFTCHGTPP